MPTIAELLAEQAKAKTAQGSAVTNPEPKIMPSEQPARFIPTINAAKLLSKATLPDWAYLKTEKGEEIVLDSDQRRAVEMAISGKSFVLIGKAGTGKTTTMQAINLALLTAHAHKIIDTEYRIKGKGDHVPGISIGVVAFANRAANNIRNKCQAHPDLKHIMNYNVTTLHNMLEYSVEFYDDPETGKTKRRYFPIKDELNKLELTHLEVEESSMVPVGDGSIWDQLYKALPTDVQVIFLGDPNQLPPVGGKPVIAYAMRDLPIVELTHVHRQALDNPIIAQALNCLEGKTIETQYDQAADRGVRLIDPATILKRAAKIKLHAYEFTETLTAVIERLIQLNKYDPLQDIVLCPNNKQDHSIVNTQDINAFIATYLSHKVYDREVYEIKAGFNTVYVAIGDKVMVDKYEGIVQRISTNGSYIGPVPKLKSKRMDYFGHVHGGTEFGELSLEGGSTYEALDIDSQMTSAEEDAEQEKTRAASHIVDIELEDGTIVTLSSAGDFGQQAFSLGYAISVHKAQGSEWRNVIVALHESNGSKTLLYRELLYTAMTRAVNRLDIFAQEFTIPKAVRNPRMKGNTIADKLEFFASGYLDLEVPLVPPSSSELESNDEQ